MVEHIPGDLHIRVGQTILPELNPAVGGFTPVLATEFVGEVARVPRFGNKFAIRVHHSSCELFLGLTLGSGCSAKSN